MSRCRHRLVAEYLTAKRRRPIPANYRPGHGAAWHPGVLRLVCVTCGETLPLGPARDTAETEVECRAAELARGDRMTVHESWGYEVHADDWISDGTPDDPEGQAGWLAREMGA